MVFTIFNIPKTSKNQNLNINIHYYVKSGRVNIRGGSHCITNQFRTALIVILSISIQNNGK
jgi:hypothetical protein